MDIRNNYVRIKINMNRKKLLSLLNTRSIVGIMSGKLIQINKNFKIIPDCHKVTDFRTFFYYFFTFIECKHNISYFFKLYSTIKSANQQKLFLSTLPRSGTGHIDRIHKSIMSQLNGGSGKPFYNSKNNSFEFEVDSSGYSTTLRNLVYICNLKKPNQYAFCHAHHPIQKADLININTLRPVFTLRNPFDACKSWYYHGIELPDVPPSINKKIGLEESVMVLTRFRQIINYFNYWGKYIERKNEGEDYYCIKYEDLVKDPYSIVGSLYQFWGIDIKNRHLVEAIAVNSYENTQQRVKMTLGNGALKSKTISFYNKPDFGEDIMLLLKQEQQRNLHYDFGYEL